jgi:phosphoribosylanthranilate isomerase
MLVGSARTRNLFQIKICGITSVQGAQLSVLAGADAVGLNFYEKSKRFVELEVARRIVEVIPTRVARVGLFVNASVDSIQEIAETLQLDCIQLHGDEPPEFVSSLANRKILRAFRCARSEFNQIGDYLSECLNGGRLPEAILVDAHRQGQYGGTGEVVDWSSLVAAREQFAGVPLVLAGGLTPFNVTDAISVVSPTAVDTASGVEREPGHQDPMLLRAFVKAAKQAFSNVT